MDNLLEIKGLSGGYTKNPVLHDISFNVNRNEIVGLIGLNGAGKSTTIKHIIGLMKPKSGEIRIDGKTFHDNPDKYRSTYSFIPETPVLYEELTLFEHLELTAMAYGISKEDFENRVVELAKKFRMEKKLKWFPHHFSKGMKQKVMIMCAFLVQPSLYIVDEPFVGLDPVGIDTFLQYMTQFKENGSGILMSTHILSTAERYCDRFVILHDGKVVANGNLEELRNSLQAPNESLHDMYIRLTREDDDV